MSFKVKSIAIYNISPGASCTQGCICRHFEVGDVLALLSAFGCTTGCEDQDLDGDGAMSVPDLLALLGVLGSTCPY